MEAPDLARAVADLKRRKPFLFRSVPRRAAMGAEPGEGEAPLESAAAEARQSGDRSALLRYLRLKRS
jgi:hypothetical protein